MRLIDADALHEEISKWPESVMYKDWVQSAIANAPTIVPPPNDPLTLEELREMEGEPVWGADGQCYIVNVKAGYAVDKDRGFRMLWSDGFFYRRRPEEVDTCQKTSSRSG